MLELTNALMCNYHAKTHGKNHTREVFGYSRKHLTREAKSYKQEASEYGLEGDIMLLLSNA